MVSLGEMRVCNWAAMARVISLWSAKTSLLERSYVWVQGGWPPRRSTSRREIAHLTVASGNSALEQVSHSEFSRDRAEIAIFTSEIRTRALRADDFHPGKPCQIGSDFILHPDGEKRVLTVGTGIFEGQDGDRFLHLGN